MPSCACAPTSCVHLLMGSIPRLGTIECCIYQLMVQAWVTSSIWVKELLCFAWAEHSRSLYFYLQMCKYNKWKYTLICTHFLPLCILTPALILIFCVYLQTFRKLLACLTVVYPLESRSMSSDFKSSALEHLYIRVSIVDINIISPSLA